MEGPKIDLDSGRKENVSEKRPSSEEISGNEGSVELTLEEKYKISGIFFFYKKFW